MACTITIIKKINIISLCDMRVLNNRKQFVCLCLLIGIMFCYICKAKW